MSSRKERRMEAHKARKLARKLGFPPVSAEPADTAAAEPVGSKRQDEAESFILFPVSDAADGGATMPQPGIPFPSLSSISAAKLEANRQNAKLSKGPLTEATKAVSSQNHTTHGLARHQNGTLKLLTSEDPASFAALQKSLIDEHQPATPTESILVHRMAESDWLAQRAQRLQDTCLDPDSGEIKDEKKFTLYMRYQTTHTRAFRQCLSDLQKLRKEKRQAELGVEAQRVESEKHEMKKDAHYWEVLRKDAFACQQLSLLAAQNCAARRQDPEFQAEYEVEFAKRGLTVNGWEAARRAA